MFNSGGNFNEILLPKLHTTLPIDDLYKQMSWYDSPPYNSDNEACFVKIHIQVNMLITLGHIVTKC